MYCTANPHADAERWEDDQEALYESEEQAEEDRRSRWARELVDAAPLEESTKLHGQPLADRLAELVCERPKAFIALLDSAILHPAMRGAVWNFADEYVNYFRATLKEKP